jgi:trehalose synthase
MSNHSHDGRHHVEIVPIASRDLSCFREVLGDTSWRAVAQTLSNCAAQLRGRTIWNVNTTATGGGVAEMLRSLVAYACGAGADVRWAVIAPPPGLEDFFAITKRIHNMLHGYPGDSLGLPEQARSVYRAALAPTARELQTLIRPSDVVVLHDPQTAGLVPAVRAFGATVIWRCHVGADNPNGEAHEVWDFLLPFVAQADRYVFSRSAHIWQGLDHARTLIVPPSIDAFSPKNQPLSAAQIDAILQNAGTVAGAYTVEPTFRRDDGTVGRVQRRAQMLGVTTIDPSRPLVTQVSRWDMLKDPLGVMEAFVRYVLPAVPEAQLALVGPDTAAVADDPEGSAVLSQCRDAWRSYPVGTRDQIALVCLPMSDVEENAAIVNAIQRRSTVVGQKSLAEGFGLTVSEAMWKGRPVIASAVGGIVDQIVDGDSGLLVQDPTDLREFGEAIASMLRRPVDAARIGRRARQRVADHFLTTRSLVQYAQAVTTLTPEVREHSTDEPAARPFLAPAILAAAW